MATRSALRRGPVSLFLAACLSTAAFGEQPELHRTEIGIQGGFFLPDKDLSNKDSELQEIEPLGGLRLAVRFGKRFDWFIDTNFSDVNRNAVGLGGGPTTDAQDIETRDTRTGVDIYFRPHGKKVQWFTALGGGFADFDAELAEDFDRTFASLGIGQRVRLDERVNFRWELRADQAFDDGDLVDGEDITRTAFMISVNWGLGRSRKDSDGDGVRDRDDDCPDTPDCAIVDERGCPKDSDGDGVYDGCDKCPDTPRCAIVDEEGCPRDSDGDGVYDGCDKCPDTPPSTPVREDGCPKAEPLFIEERDELILNGVYFEFDKAVLKPVSRTVLDEVAQSLLDWPEIRLEVQGHTDWTGTDEYNLDLSRRRAETVKEYLVSRGVAADRLEPWGYGESKPISDNQTAEGRAKNRRVVLKKLE